MAFIGIAVITFFTFNSQQSKKNTFKRRIVKQDTLQKESWLRLGTNDSLEVNDFTNQYVLLQFWTSWLDEPEKVHQELVNLQKVTDHRLEIVSALVGFKKKKAYDYVETHDYPIKFVVGSLQFDKYGVPGVPAYMLFGPEKDIQYISFGRLEETNMDSLKAIIMR